MYRAIGRGVEAKGIPVRNRTVGRRYGLYLSKTRLLQQPPQRIGVVHPLVHFSLAPKSARHQPRVVVVAQNQARHLVFRHASEVLRDVSPLGNRRIAGLLARAFMDTCFAADSPTDEVYVFGLPLQKLHQLAARALSYGL